MHEVCLLLVEPDEQIGIIERGGRVGKRTARIINGNDVNVGRMVKQMQVVLDHPHTFEPLVLAEYVTQVNGNIFPRHMNTYRH